MFLKIKNQVDRELLRYLGSINQLYCLNRLSPLLFNNIREFIGREGKRIRPILFCIGYLGFSRRKKAPPGLYRSALALELLHDFMLVHDDIIDKSDTRRGKPAMHALFRQSLAKNKKIKFDGEDLAIVAGDVIYAMALDAFLAVREDLSRKEQTLRKLFLAALYTGSGEFIELLLGAKPIEQVLQADVYKIYDYKTANYTFASPLTMGATLAGANQQQIAKLHAYGMLLGRAFQIKDDIIGTFGEFQETGKSNLTDIKEAKRTLLVWFAFKRASAQERRLIKMIMANKTTRRADFEKMRSIIISTGALAYAKDQITQLSAQAQNLMQGLKLDQKYKRALNDFAQQTLKT